MRHITNSRVDLINPCQHSPHVQINLLVCRFMDATGYGCTSDAVQCLDW